MANAKIIAIIDHENRALRHEIAEGTAQIFAEAMIPMQQKLRDLCERVERLEKERDSPPINP